MRKAIAAIALCVVGLGGVAASTHAGNRGDLFGPAFKSVKVAKNGEPHPRFEATTVRLEFERQGRRDFAGWRAKCNHMGGRVDIGTRRLEFRTVYTTLIGCRPSRAKQDRWLMRFFDADPEWTLAGRKLTLTNGGDRIVLRQRR